METDIRRKFHNFVKGQKLGELKGEASGNGLWTFTYYLDGIVIATASGRTRVDAENAAAQIGLNNVVARVREQQA